MDAIVELFGDDPQKLIGAIAIIGGLTIATISIVTSALVRIVQTTERERSRRELAAYVAEGTMQPEVAERLLSKHASKGRRRGCGWMGSC